MRLDVGGRQGCCQGLRLFPLPEDRGQREEAGRDQGNERPGRNRVTPAPPPQSAEEPHRPSPDWLVVQEPTQVPGKFLGRRVPLPRLFLQALQADRLQVAWRARLEVAGRNGGPADDLEQRGNPVRSQERWPPGQHFVQDHAERIDVCGGRGRCRRASPPVPGFRPATYRLACPTTSESGPIRSGRAAWPNRNPLSSGYRMEKEAWTACPVLADDLVTPRPFRVAARYSPASSPGG